MRLIDADALTKKIKDILPYLDYEQSMEAKERIKEIDEAPSIDLVRCKDCKHWYSDADTGMACEFTNMGQPEDGYCNWGERRADG